MTSKYRPIRRYRRTERIDGHLKASSLAQQEDYADCAQTLDAVMYELFKTTERFHIVADAHGPLWHVEVIDIIAKLEAVQEIARDKPTTGTKEPSGSEAAGPEDAPGCAPASDDRHPSSLSPQSAAV